MSQQLVAFIFLGYVVVPLVAYFVYWLIKRLRRGGADGEPAEGEP